LTNIFYQLEEASFQLRDYSENLHYDEARLNEIESRLHDISRLQKKYGPSVNEILTYKENVTTELEKLEHQESHLEALQTKIIEKKQIVMELAHTLHDLRQQSAVILEKDIKVELSDLYLGNARFSVSFADTTKRDPDENGLDDVTFMLSANLGEPMKELAKTASGGELSRIMLALKKVFSKHDQIATVIFDEIDSGVSGRVAQTIAEKMFQISATTQVICITHLAQVAAMSDHHLLIQKEVMQQHTHTILRELNGKGKIEELGKMMTGSKLTNTAMEHSKEMLALTNAFKAANS
jgi:DNA repair protein RecN (Recombination protein N)